MRRKPARFTLRIDRITVDQPTLDRAALEAAVRAEISRFVAAPDAAALRCDIDRPTARAVLSAGKSTLAVRVAAATVDAVKAAAAREGPHARSARAQPTIEPTDT